jgi:hypothetical protein
MRALIFASCSKRATSAASLISSGFINFKARRLPVEICSAT